MNKKLNLLTLVLIVIGNMIGAGVFVTSGLALGDLGSRDFVMLAWIVGGLIAISGAISYGMLAREISESGGEYVLLHRKLHPAAGCIAGIISVVCGFSGAIAFATLTLETYVSNAIPALNILPMGMLASMVVTSCFLLHYFTKTSGILLQNIIIGLKIICLLIFIAVALIVHKPLPPTSHHAVEFSFSTFSTVVMWVFFCYSGFNASIYIAEQSKKPEYIPRSMLIGTIIVTIIYIILNAIFLYIPAQAYIIGQADIAAKAAFIIGGPGFSGFIQLIIIISLLSSVSTMIQIGPHIITKMANDGFLPKQFSNQDSSTGSISNSTILLQLVIILFLIWSSELKQLVSYLGINLIISSGLTVSIIFKQHRANSLQSWCTLVPPMFFILSSIIFSVLTAFNNPQACVFTLLTILSGLIVYKITQVKKHVLATMTLVIDDKCSVNKEVS